MKLSLEAITGKAPLSGLAPKNIKICPAGSRVAFLQGNEHDAHQLDLWHYDIATGRSALLVDTKAFNARQDRVSTAELDRRERQRTSAMSGIVDYHWYPSGQSLLFSLDGALYTQDVGDDTPRVSRKLMEIPGSVTDAKVSPNGRFVSFIFDRDLWIFEHATSDLRRLTYDGSETTGNGVAEFVADEEMDRHTGYWWAPDESAIAFVQIDESCVAVKVRNEIHADNTRIVEQRYPSAGTKNVGVRLGVVSVDACPTTDWIDLGADADIYLARVQWRSPGILSYQRQSRDQKTLELVEANVADGSQRVLVRESADAWVPLHNSLHFLSDGRFIWSSERSGFQHLYLADQTGENIVPLTKGNWAVDDLLSVDEELGEVFFSAARESPLERHIYKVPIRGGAVQRISRSPGMHEGYFSPDASFYVDSWSSEASLPQTEIFSKGGLLLGSMGPASNASDPAHPYRRFLEHHQTAEFGTIEAEDGQTELQYSILKPPDFDPTQCYPVIVYIYGGPAAQTVTRSWPVRADAIFNQYLAQNGYIVFSLDNRGTPRRGANFGNSLYGRQGTVEVSDQIRAVEWLKSHSFVDASRIGIYGWSNGGYLTLMLLAKHSSVFKCGVAGAPVTDWSLYDTHYTERYMGSPDVNPDGYREANILTHCASLSSPLLLIHGMADDNVLFENSTRLMSALQEQGILFEAMTYPGAKHSFNGTAQLHRYRTTENFFSRHLTPGQ